jgi:hypothetical protein
MKHILNEMNDEERNSIRSQYTGTLSVQTGKFKQLVENKLGNAKPLVSEQLDSFTAFDESDDFDALVDDEEVLGSEENELEEEEDDDVDYGGEDEEGGASRVEYVINKIDGVDELIQLLGGEDSAERILRRYKPLGLESLDDLIEYKGGYPEEEDYGDEGASRMNESDETTLKEKIMTAIRNSTSNKEEIIDVLEKILREKKGVGYVTKDKVLKNFKK